jgi:integrase
MQPVRLWQRPNGIWYVIYPGGVMRSTRTRDAAKARRIFEGVEKKLIESRLVHLSKGETRPLSVFVREYSAARAGLAPATQKMDRLALGHLLDFFGDRPVAHLTDRTLDQFRGHLKARFSSVHTANDYIRAVKKALRTAIKWGYLARKAREGTVGVDLDGFRQFKHVHAVTLDVDASDVGALIKAAQAHPVMRTVIPLMFYCGIARAELMGPLHVSEDAISYTRHKTGKPVRVYISSALRPFVAHLRPGIHRLVPWSNPRTFNRHFRAVLGVIDGLEELTPHKARHVFASFMLKAGVPIKLVSEFLGHSSIEITLKYYGHLIPGMDREAVEKLRYGEE